MQGVLTGIGFLGAGVIVRRNIDDKVHGLTSAACAWTAACVGLVCGLGEWPIVATGVVLMFALLVFGGPFERMFHRRLGPPTEPAPRRHAAAAEPSPKEPA
jgi:putative Mg2+ transporter-C (MgtC) family protein